MKFELTINIILVESDGPENQQLIKKCSCLQVIFIRHSSAKEEGVNDADNR
jgi:hypothetical protein